MTCVECKFQWCWLCENEYSPGHFERGTCRGMQFAKRDFVRSGIETCCDCCICDENNPFLDECMERSPTLFCFEAGGFFNFMYLFMLTYFFTAIIFAVAGYMGITQDAQFNPCAKGFMNVICFFISSMIWICFQIPITCIILAYSVLSLLYLQSILLLGYCI